MISSEVMKICVGEGLTGRGHANSPGEGEVNKPKDIAVSKSNLIDIRSNQE